MDIAYTVNSKYIKYLYVSLMSLLEHNRDNSLCVHILSYDLTQEDMDSVSNLVSKYDQQVRFYKISGIDDFREKTSIGYGVEVYLRLFIPNELKGVSKVLFIDADTLIMEDIASFFDSEMNGMALRACPDGPIGQNLLKSRNDIFARTDDLTYYNAGVMLWNLDHIRETTSFEDFIKVIELFGNRLFFNDQDVLNYLFAGKIEDFGSCNFNYMTDLHGLDDDFEKEIASALIIHFAGCNPWKYGKKDRADFKLWWDYAEKSPYYDDIIEETLENAAKLIDEKDRLGRIYKAYSEYRLNGRFLSEHPLVKKSRRIIIYGAGSWGKLLIDELDDVTDKIAFILDKRSGDEIKGIRVLPVDAIKTESDADLIIITPYKYVSEIKEQLLEMTDTKMVGLVELFEG